MHQLDQDETEKISGTLPPVETTPILYIRFTSKAPTDLRNDVVARLKQVGIIIIPAEAAGVLGLTTTQSLLENEAEIVKLVKPCRTNDVQIMEHFSIAARDNFIHIDESIDMNNNQRFYDSLGLFTAAERVLLLQRMVDSIPALDLMPQFHSNTEDDNSKTFLVTTLKSLGYVDVVCPAHIPHLREYILRDTMNFMSDPPVHAIRNYYGENVAFYFAWMDFSSKWIRFPGAIGLLIYCVRKYRGDTVDTCELTPLFGIVMFFWATLFNRFWERQEASLAYQWGSYAVTDRDELEYGKRANFKGETIRRSPVTGRMEVYSSPSIRKLKCAVSILVSMLLLVLPCLLMILFMNMQGYISVDDATRWEMDKGYSHPLHFPFFARLAEAGGIFDASSWKCFLPVILRPGVVNFLNQMYRRVAVVLTEWENHELDQHHRSSLVLKRFAFEAFDAYVVLFYLAFYERNIHLLRLELVGALSADTFRRLLLESVIPFALHKLSATRKNLSTKKNDDTSEEQNSSTEIDMEEYELFDDYIEMLINFGYITLFASAFPLASFVTVFANVVEYRSDCFKLRLVDCVSVLRGSGVSRIHSLQVSFSRHNI